MTSWRFFRVAAKQFCFGFTLFTLGGWARSRADVVEFGIVAGLVCVAFGLWQEFTEAPLDVLLSEPKHG
ncbi:MULTISPECIES: hypothetical protein [unclassified Sphingobium]|uniref:hypothetical protein n=1 Tax=unclassified Sphingobium TaxID=2611147 RepID=UPI0035A5BC87